MYVKLGDNVINLDMIREIAGVVGVLHDENEDYRQVLDESSRERWEDISVNGDEGQRKYTVVYGFHIHYIGENYPKLIEHPDKAKLTVAREQLCVLLNGNKPLMKVIL